MNRLILMSSIIFLMLTGYNCKAQKGEWSITSYDVSFKIKNAGFKVDGKFTALMGTIKFDAAKTYSNLIEAIIDVKSINTGNNTRDGHLKKKEYFDADTYPNIIMKATLFSKEKDGTYRGYFKLTIKNKTRDIVVPFSFTETDSKGLFKGEFTINRLDYGVGESSLILSDNTTITIQVNVIKK